VVCPEFGSLEEFAMVHPYVAILLLVLVIGRFGCRLHDRLGDGVRRIRWTNIPGFRETGAILLAALLVGCQQGGRGFQEEQEAAKREVGELAAVTGILLQTYMDARVTEMLVMSKCGVSLEEALRTREALSAANRVLKEWMVISRAYEAMVVLDKAGLCVAGAPAELVDQDLSSEEGFAGAVQGKLTLTDAHKSKLLVSLDTRSIGWTVVIAVPLGSADKSTGVLMSYLAWSRLEELTASIRIGATGYAYVMDRDGRIIVHPGRALYGKELRGPPINLPDLAEAVQSKMRNHSYKFKNIITGRLDNKLAGFAYPTGCGNFPGLGWTVGAVGDEAELVGGQTLWRRLLR